MPLDSHTLTQIAETCVRDRETGRLWKSRDRLRQRIAQSDYDTALFRLYAEVLTDMHDDDEAGRFFFLSGERDGRAADLSKAFLDRRHRRKLHLLWGEMPKAASRVTATSIPAICRRDLEADGHTREAVSIFFGKLVDAEIQRIVLKARPADEVATSLSWTEMAIISTLIVPFFLALALGVIELGEWFYRIVLALIRWW